MTAYGCSFTSSSSSCTSCSSSRPSHYSETFTLSHVSRQRTQLRSPRKNVAPAQSQNGKSTEPSAAGFAPPSSNDPELWGLDTHNDSVPAQHGPSEGNSYAEIGAAPQKPSTLAAVFQGIQLSLVLAALLLWPAATQPAGLVCMRVWLIYVIYWIFFALSTIQRQLKFGKLSPRKEDKQRSSLPDRLALLSFITAVVLLHWLPVLRYTKLGIYPTQITSYEVLGLFAVGAAIILNHRAGKDLGEAWDRVVTPKKLVTTGAYAHMQHPIYTSYMLLFFGTAMLLHSAPTALLFIIICSAYYSRRTKLESTVLEAAFGDSYRAYTSKTGRFLPFFHLPRSS